MQMDVEDVTWEDITIDAHRVLTFKPSVMLKDAMNGSGVAE
jgi:nucleoid DNA-binding protein